IMSIWGAEGVELIHEPPLKNMPVENNEKMTLSTFVAHQIGQDIGLANLGDDYRYELSSMDIDEGMIVVDYKMAVTPSDGKTIRLPLEMKYVINEGRMNKWIINTEHYSSNEMKELQAARANNAN